MNLLLAPALAAPGDTWGISGPTFLTVYLTVAALTVAVGAVHRWRVLAGSSTPGVGQLGSEQVAYLNGGRQLAGYAAVGWLRGAGAIGVDRRRLVATGPLPAGSSRLAWAVHNSVGRPSTLADVYRDSQVRAALDDLGNTLERDGLAVGPDRRRSARLGATALAVLMLVGAVRLFVGIMGDRPIGFLVVALVALLLLRVPLARVPYRTRAGAEALRSLRQRHAHLAPQQSPAYSTYGAAGAAMGVALFGTASLWALDPTFAQQAEIQRQAAASSAGSSSGTSCGGGGGDSGGDSGGGGCGGGGCGGGCGG